MIRWIEYIFHFWICVGLKTNITFFGFQKNHFGTWFSITEPWHQLMRLDSKKLRLPALLSLPWGWDDNICPFFSGFKRLTGRMLFHSVGQKSPQKNGRRGGFSFTLPTFEDVGDLSSTGLGTPTVQPVSAVKVPRSDFACLDWNSDAWSNPFRCSSFWSSLIFCWMSFLVIFLLDLSGLSGVSSAGVNRGLLLRDCGVISKSALASPSAGSRAGLPSGGCFPRHRLVTSGFPVTSEGFAASSLGFFAAGRSSAAGAEDPGAEAFCLCVSASVCFISAGSGAAAGRDAAWTLGFFGCGTWEHGRSRSRFTVKISTNLLQDAENQQTCCMQNQTVQIKVKKGWKWLLATLLRGGPCLCWTVGDPWVFHLQRQSSKIWKENNSFTYTEWTPSR